MAKAIGGKPYDKEIFLVRHGSLPDYCLHKLVGQNDTPLSEEGISDAGACGRFLSEYRFDALYAGSLRRVSETLAEARRFAPELPEAKIDSGFNEFDFGDWCMKSLEHMSEEEERIFEGWNFGNWGFRFPGGESTDEFATRTRAAFRRVLDAPGERVAIFAHGGVIMSLLADVVGLDRSRSFDLWVERGALAIVRVKAAAGRGRLRLIGKPSELEGISRHGEVFP